MIVIPSLELLGGKVVRRASGADDAEVLATDPVDAARTLVDDGAVFFQVVDLDAVSGKGDNLAVVESLVASEIPCQVRGGVRDVEDVERLFELGADRVVAGAMFQENVDAGREIVERFGPRIIGAIDDEDGYVYARGVRREETVDAAFESLRSLGVEHVVYSSIGRDVDPARIRELCASTDIEVFASVELRERAQLDTLRELKEHGLAGVVLSAAVAAMSVLS